MQHPCAYCKITGHHIRDCEERKATEERKRVSVVAKQPANTSQCWRKVAVTTTPKYAPPTLLRKVETVKNSFANLYSSSEDELEEGEISEEPIVRPRRVVSVSDSESESSSDTTPTKWSRSCVKVVIPTQLLTHDDDEEEEKEEVECDYDKLYEGIALMSAYVARFKGMNWADIESDTD